MATAPCRGASLLSRPHLGYIVDMTAAGLVVSPDMDESRSQPPAGDSSKAPALVLADMESSMSPPGGYVGDSSWPLTRCISGDACVDVPSSVCAGVADGHGSGLPFIMASSHSSSRFRWSSLRQHA